MSDKKIEDKIDGKIDKTTDRLTTIAEKAKELAHAVTGEVRDAAHKTGDAVKHAGEKIKKFVS